MEDIDYYDDLSLDFNVLLASDGRDFLIRNNGDQVKINRLIGEKIVALYFHSPEAPNSYSFAPILVNLCQEIALSKGQDFEVVMVSSYNSGGIEDEGFEDQGSFDAFFAQMPWLAVPHCDSKAVQRRFFSVAFNNGLNTSAPLMIIDKRGSIPIGHGTEEIILYYGAEAYPFTRDRISFLDEQDAVAKENQSITSLLGDYLFRCGTTQQVPVSQLVGKTVGLYYLHKYIGDEFSCLLIEVYNEIKEKGGEFEIVIIPAYWLQPQQFLESIESMPWLALPFGDSRSLKLWHYFPKSLIPELIGPPPLLFMIGPDGKNLSFYGTRMVRELGADAFPFTPQKLAEIEERKREPWSLEKVLVFRGQDFVIRKDGSKLPVADLVGKTILFYFSEPDLVSSLDKVIESCHKIKKKNKDDFEVIFIGFDHLEDSDIDECMLKVTGLKDRLTNYWFDICGFPTAILVDPSCQIVTRNAIDIIGVHGAEAYPFTKEHLKELDDRAERIAREWPEKLSHEIHEHELDRVRCIDLFDCDGCYWSRNRWNFVCNECRGFDLHNDCDFGGPNGIGKPDGRRVMEDFVVKK